MTIIEKELSRVKGILRFPFVIQKDGLRFESEAYKWSAGFDLRWSHFLRLLM